MRDLPKAWNVYQGDAAHRNWTRFRRPDEEACVSRTLALVCYALILRRRSLPCRVTVSKSRDNPFDTDVGRRDGRAKALVLVEELNVRRENAPSLCLVERSIRR